MPSLLRRFSAKLSDRTSKVKTDQDGTVSLDKVEETKPSTFVPGQIHTNTKQESSMASALAETKHVHGLTSAGIAKGQGVSYHGQDEHDMDKPATRVDVEKTFAQHAALIHVSGQPIPEQRGPSTYTYREASTGFWSDIKSLGIKDVKTVRNIIADKASGLPQDDRTMHMEQIIQLVAALPSDSANRVELTSSFLNELWNSLQHPPLSYMSDEYRYRSADGRNNSYMFPMLGAANTPYSRSVCPKLVQPGALPDPGLIFDSILARENFIENPNRISSIFFNFASLVIHDLFQSDHDDFGISKTSSYLDLSILYGDSQEDQNMMRTFKNGKIKPDCFAEERLLAFPPSCGVLLIMFNRYHNYIVENLALINEGGRFNKPPSHLTGEASERAWKRYDDDLFQTGRLITCGLYINITLYDYLRTIVNLNRTNSSWALDPRLEKGTHYDSAGTPRGLGNQVSAEFNLSYRWHSCVSQTDEVWTEQVYEKLFGRDAQNLSVRELMMGLNKHYGNLPEDPAARPFAGLERNADGRYDDGELSKIFTTACESVSGAFGARNIPKVLRSITILGIEQSRSWNLASLNEYRAHFGLKTYDTFEEINSDPYVAQQLRSLYEHPDYVELYPGLAIESYKDPMVPGVGICPTYTISRIVLADAVALVRGDRFYTLDYGPKAHTNFGFKEQNYDLNFNSGCVFYKLLLRALPDHFESNSIYAHEPMTVPDENRKIMKDLGRYHDYEFSQPKTVPQVITLKSVAGARQLNDLSRFSLSWNDGLSYILGPTGNRSPLAGNTTQHQQAREHLYTVTHPEGWKTKVKRFYDSITSKLLQQHTVNVAGRKQVDIADICNLASVHFVASLFDLPLRTAQNPDGVFTEQELWMALCTIHSAIFLDHEPAKSMPMRKVAQKLARMLGRLIEVNIKSVTNTSLTSRFFDNHRENQDALHEVGHHTLRQLVENSNAHEATFAQILPAIVAFVPIQSKGLTEVIDFYLSEDGMEHLPVIEGLVETDSPEADERLLAYINEALRLNSNTRICRRAEVNDVIVDGQEEIHVKVGDKVTLLTAGLAHDLQTFADPNVIRLDRDPKSYIYDGIVESCGIGRDTLDLGVMTMFRHILKLKNLRRAPGPQGQLKKVIRPDGSQEYMRDDHGSYFAFPCCLKVHFDGKLPDWTQVNG